MSLADQIASLEADHAAATAQISTQNSSIETLTVSLAAMTKQKLALEAEKSALEARVADLEQHQAETIAAVETLANASLDMLRTAQRPAGTPAAVIPFAPKPRAVDVLLTDDMLKQQAEINAAVADTMQTDSGDEHRPPPAATKEQIDAILASVEPDTPVDLNPIKQALENLAAPAQPDAMSRIRPTSSALLAISLVRPPDGPAFVRHDSQPLPMFLQRGTSFDSVARGGCTCAERRA